MEPQVRLKVVIFSHLSDTKLEDHKMANKRIEFVKWLMNKYNDLDKQIYPISEFSAFEKQNTFV